MNGEELKIQDVLESSNEFELSQKTKEELKKEATESLEFWPKA